MRVGVYTGSFDPLTLGHADVIASAGRLVDRLLVAVGTHPGKSPLFSAAERLELVRTVCGDRLAASGCELVTESFDGLAVELARSAGASVLIRGLRDGTDFDYEMQMAGTNRALAPEIQTLFLPASPGVRHISSTLVRQIAQLGGDVEALAPQPVARALAAKLGAPSKR
jgi:pantetheine-phosphate adenylyltransferase